MVTSIPTWLGVIVPIVVSILGILLSYQIAVSTRRLGARKQDFDELVLTYREEIAFLERQKEDLEERLKVLQDELVALREQLWVAQRRISSLENLQEHFDA